MHWFITLTISWSRTISGYVFDCLDNCECDTEDEVVHCHNGDRKELALPSGNLNPCFYFAVPLLALWCEKITDRRPKYFSQDNVCVDFRSLVWRITIFFVFQTRQLFWTNFQISRYVVMALPLEYMLRIGRLYIKFLAIIPMTGMGAGEKGIEAVSQNWPKISKCFTIPTTMRLDIAYVHIHERFWEHVSFRARWMSFPAKEVVFIKLAWPPTTYTASEREASCLIFFTTGFSYTFTICNF